MPRTSRYDLPPVGAENRFLRDAIQGLVNVAGEVVLSGTETIIEDALFTTTTEVTLIPRDATGAAISWWLSARMSGRIVIGHDDPGGARLFGYIAIG